MNKSTNTTTKQRTIDFICHLWAQNFTAKEIAKIYDVTPSKINSIIQRVKAGTL